MANKPDRDALSKLVVYPQNAHFVRTGEGDIYPYHIIQEQIREYATAQLKNINSEGRQNLLFLWLGVPGVFALMMMHSLFWDGARNPAAPVGPAYACLSCCLINIAVALLNLYQDSRIKRDPERIYLNRLKKGRLIRGRVKQVTPLSNGIVELTHTFEQPWPTRQDKTAVRRYTAVTRIEPSKIFEEGDEVLVLYYDDDLMTIL